MLVKSIHKKMSVHCIILVRRLRNILDIYHEVIRSDWYFTHSGIQRLVKYDCNALMNVIASLREILKMYWKFNSS